MGVDSSTFMAWWDLRTERKRLDTSENIPHLKAFIRAVNHILRIAVSERRMLLWRENTQQSWEDAAEYKMMIEELRLWIPWAA
ncbi:hypothetical protein ANO14919_034440 [Xylariales sp. No.14919]|nr:hypothetical protein ANO14919_034440 [Xylariales sp. No.14919]